MSKPRISPRHVEVLSKSLEHPNLMRLVITGDLADYPQPEPAAHFKLFLPKAGQSEVELPDLSAGRPRWSSDEAKPWVRTYTVRDFDRKSQQLTVDLVLHEHGPASDWAKAAKVGSRLAISAPGGPEQMLPEADEYWLAGDLSAIPAIAALLENLPENAIGQVWLLEGSDPTELVNKRPAGMNIRWIPHNESSPGQLLEAMQAYGWTSNVRRTCWIAGEHHDVVSIRKWLRRECTLERSLLYAVPYWKKGEGEEAYHNQRHDVMDDES